MVWAHSYARGVNVFAARLARIHLLGKRLLFSCVDAQRHVARPAKPLQQVVWLQLFTHWLFIVYMMFGGQGRGPAWHAQHNLWLLGPLLQWAARRRS
jgi:hypothetical protein